MAQKQILEQNQILAQIAKKSLRENPLRLDLAKQSALKSDSKT
ncbi:hypothetical protein [Helicobacter sp. T3_23-1056]